MAEPKTIKVCLTNRGDDQETPWAHDLGPAPGPRGSRKARLVNVPFMHAKPTWGDVIVVSPVADGLPTWDRDGVAWSKIGARILEDGGRWAMIVDYMPHEDGGDRGTAGGLDTLARACAELDIVCEGAWGPRGAEPGRAYLAVKNGTSDSAVMNHLARADLSCTLAQIHPKPTSTPRARAAAPPTGGAPSKRPKPRAKPAKPPRKQRTPKR